MTGLCEYKPGFYPRPYGSHVFYFMYGVCFRGQFPYRLLCFMILLFTLFCARCHMFRFALVSSSIFVSPHFSRAHSTHSFHLYILHIFHFTRESSRRVLEYGSKKNIAKNRLYYVSAVSEGSFGLQRS